MNTALTLVIVLLIVLLVVCLMLYVGTQQDLRVIQQRLSAMDTPAKPANQRTAEVVRRERSEAHDKIVLIEASLSTQPREELTADELATYENSRRIIQARNAELRRTQDWLGLPYDLEWSQVQERLPKLCGLYRKAVTAALGQEQETGPTSDGGR
jgi:uncharacterized membrane protein YdfJ with MMPL/SSD domain